ncbi:alpha/beta fold hydrolase [Telmatospirillum sp. J64-1]|uniref:alpha/beta fold hydrolase n=1 Tax=Telmatospirillum sp. J64-1 TaxID=2502183 RepID=UPI00115EC820|nr:alpha/beta hydrolase [Telmatospirillum sp. J64-1]
MTIGHRILGKGPEKVIILHGWMGDHSAFEPVFPFLDEDAFTFAFIDYRGYGASRDMKGEYSIAEICDDAVQLADQLGWDRFHAVGHSMGGMAVQWLAAYFPERLKSVVALTPVPANGYPMDEDTLILFRSAADSAEARGTILSFTTGQRLGRMWEKRMVERSFATTTPEAHRGYFEAWMGTDFAEDVDGCELPIKVLVGDNDPAMSADLMWNTVMKWFPNAEIEVMSNSGHYPMQEIPVWLAQEIQSYMQAHA